MAVLTMCYIIQRENFFFWGLEYRDVDPQSRLFNCRLPFQHFLIVIKNTHTHTKLPVKE
jgi:hypothetical protein